MLLSDDFGPDSPHAEPSKARAWALANQPEINAVARIGRAFTPVELRDGDHAVFTLQADDVWYVALFNFRSTPMTVCVDALRAGLPALGRVTDLYRGADWIYETGLSCALPPMDSAILRLKSID